MALLLLTLLLTATASAAQSTVGPSSRLVRDYGRVDHTYPDVSRFSWVMAGVGCRVTNATSLSANFSAPKSGAKLRVMVDGVFERFIVVGKDKSKGPSQGPGLHTYAVAASLRPDTTHTVQIFKVSDEGDNGDDSTAREALRGEALRGEALRGEARAAADPAGYSCAANKNYEGEKTCFGSCPTTGVKTEDACANLCNKRSGCGVFVYNNKQECYLKSDKTKIVDDDPSLGTVSCQIPQLNTLGVVGFGGFTAMGGSPGAAPTFEAAPAALARRLEFIGDSDTAGWCADGSPKTGDDKLKESDAYLTWAMQIARNVSADVMVEAYSGYGVTSSSTPIQTIRDSTLGFETDPLWNYSRWVPDAVMILIGPNDEYEYEGQNEYEGQYEHAHEHAHAAAEKEKPSHENSGLKKEVGSKSFIKKYLGLLNRIKGDYAGAATTPKIIHVCGGSLNGLEPCADIQKANNQFNNQYSAEGGSGMKGYYTTITKAHWNTINGPHGKGESAYNGCDGHYNVKGHGVLAADILPQLKKAMGWD